MDILSVTEEQTETIFELAKDSTRIAGHTRKFIARLVGVCDHEQIQLRWATSIVVGDDGTTVRINSPFGKAVGSLALFVKGNDLRGRWVVRKEMLNAAGEAQLQVVTTLLFSKEGYVFRSESDERPIRASQGVVAEEDDQAYEVMESLLYLIGAKA